MVKKRRNCASPNVPESIMQSGRLEIDQEVDDREKRGVAIVEPGQQVTYDLDALIAGITDDNKYVLVSFGDPVGKEIW